MTPSLTARLVLALLALWFVAAAATAVIPVLSLDLEGMVVNHYLDWTTDYAQVWFARAEWVGPMRAALWLGLPPWMALVMLASLWRLGDVLWPQTDPLPHLSTRTRLALTAGVLVLLLAATPPLALALSTQLALEVVPWIEWYGHTDPTMEDIHALAPPVLMMVVALTGALSTRWALAPSGAWSRRPLRVRRIASLPGVGALLVLGLLATCAALLPATRALRAQGTSEGRAVHAEQCGACHERALPLYFVKTPGEWAETVRTHRAIERVALSDAEADALTAFLSGMRAPDDAGTFRTRCQNCHGSSWRRWEARPPADWEAIVARLSQWSPYYYNGETQQQIVRHLLPAKADEAATLGLTAEEYRAARSVGRDCDDCHSIGYEAPRYSEGTRAETRAMVARMSQKMAEPYDEARIDEVTDDWLRLVQDAELFARLFPHDSPDDTGGGL